MSAIGLQNGILMHQGETLELPSNIDMRHLTMLQAPQETTHLGTVDLWAYRRKNDVPFLSIAGIGSANILYVDGDFFTYDVAAASDFSISIVADISGDGQVGRGKSEFDILVNSERLGGPGQIFKFDKLLLDEFMITRPARKSGDNTVYTVKRTDSSEPVNKLFLQPGTKINNNFPAVISEEFGQSYSTWAIKTPKQQRYIVPVGKMPIQTSYHISTSVAKIGNIEISGAKKQQLDKMFEYYFNVNDNKIANSGLTTFNDVISSDYAPQLKSAMLTNKVTVAISTWYDSLSVKFLAKGESEYQMYGSGGSGNTQSGVDEFLAPVGVWHQLDTGYKRTYNIGNFSLETLKAALYEYFHQKVDYPNAGSEPVLTLQTGMGGLQLFQRMVQEQTNSQALIVNAKDFGNITGTADALSFKPSWYVELTIRMLATLRIVYNPAFDPIEENPLTNPMMPTGFRLSSYSMIIHAENELQGSGNIKLVRKKGIGGQVFMTIVNGRAAFHPLTSMGLPTGAGGNGIAGVAPNLANGYSAYFDKYMDSMYVVDPTQILKLVPVNPLTGATY